MEIHNNENLTLSLGAINYFIENQKGKVLKKCINMHSLKNILKKYCSQIKVVNSATNIVVLVILRRF